MLLRSSKLFVVYTSQLFSLLADNFYLIALTYLAFGLLGVAPGYPFALGLLLLAGIGAGFQNILLVTLIQLRTPKALLGRVMSLILVGSFGLSPLSQFLAGLFAEHFEVALLFPLGAFTGLAALFLGARWIVRLEQPSQPAVRS